MAWTYFDDVARKVFQSCLSVDNDTWERGKAWALWKGLFRMVQAIELRDEEFNSAKGVVEKIIVASN